ncbi:hypothetical protein D9Q98_003787 [Chlorella vulgaris]|uniref:Holocytochrome c-type synthase n=1 Tax=Chlorella vulgaris TaxID=3077 RepID=A0A9D4TR09_CHLVU|nr:hypothetical protein D9Q98_003787 [Chlorella vulgaris]
MLASGCPVIGGGAPPPVGNGPPAASYGGGCPVVGANQMPPSANTPLPGQSKPLSTWREQSSIPTGTSGAAPPQQAQPSSSSSDEVWVYPSQQMFYNAMRRKGWTPSEDDMAAVVAIHNAVNERAWREIQRWEEVQAGADSSMRPRLVKFRGRPQDYSPKARLLNLLGYGLPFDRHDWIVDRDGREVRYVIDFYNAAPRSDMPAAMHLDVRPALDSPGALWERLRMQMGWVASGRWTRE